MSKKINDPDSEDQRIHPPSELTQSKLDDWIIEALKKSGLVPEVFPVEPLRNERELQERLGFKTLVNKNNKEVRIIDIGGFWIKYPNENFYRLRLRESVKTKDGNAKYLSPTGSKSRVYIPPGSLENSGLPVILEGEKKSARLALAGYRAVGIQGVYNFAIDGVLIPELRDFLKKMDVFYVCYDSDIYTNINVQRAAARFIVTAINLGKNPYLILLPTEENGEKNGADDFIERRGEDAFAELVSISKPAIVSLAENHQFKQSTLTEEFARLTSNVERSRWAKLLYEHRETPKNAVLADMKAQRAKVEPEPRDVKYTAVFPELIDICEDENGSLVFLTKENGQLNERKSWEMDGETYYPPPRESLPMKNIPKLREVKRYFAEDTDKRLFNAIVKYFWHVSELPDKHYYRLLAAWTLHTYVIEKFNYSPYLWFFGIPERGKSRTGRGLVNISYRGLHVESMRDAYLIRVASNLRCTVFIDCFDVWRKAEKLGNEDFLLSRFERGVRIARVLYPEKGAHKDTVYYEIFGPTIIATNEGVHGALESRTILFTMTEAMREFDDNPPELAQALKERLTAFRARYLDRELPKMEKPIRGRLGDISKPLMQIVRAIAPEKANSFHKTIESLDEQRKQAKSETLDGRIVSVISGLEKQVYGGLLSIKSILSRLNEGVDVKYHMNSYKLGHKLKALGFIKRRREEGVYIEFDPESVKRLEIKFGLVEDDSTTYADTPSEKLHKLQELHSVNKNGRSDDVVSDVVLQEGDKTTGKLQSERADNQGPNVVSVVDDVSANVCECNVKEAREPDLPFSKLRDEDGCETFITDDEFEYGPPGTPGHSEGCDCDLCAAHFDPDVLAAFFEHGAGCECELCLES